MGYVNILKETLITTTTSTVLILLCIAVINHNYENLNFLLSMIFYQNWPIKYINICFACYFHPTNKVNGNIP